MTYATIGRWALAFWLEALLLAGVVMLFGLLSASLENFLLFGVFVSLLFVLGGIVFHEGGRHSLLQALLYLLVAGAGALAYLVFGSWMIALLAASLYYWRIHAVASAGVSHAALQRRFVLALMACLMKLALAALFGAAVHAAAFDATPYYGMMALTLGSYLVIGLLEYVTRERDAAVRPPLPIRVRLGGQLLASHSLLLIGYAAAAAVVLGLLGLLWGWAKGLLGSVLYRLSQPLLEKLTEWAEGLSGVLGTDPRVDDLLANQGQSGDQSLLPVDTGEPLLSLLEPYMLATVSLVVIAALGRAIWKRRFRKSDTIVQTAPAAEAAWTPLPTEDREDARLLREVRQWFKKAPGRADDPVRYAYYQFLQYTAAKGIPIHRFETSQEYLRRLQQSWHDPSTIELARQITRYYEQYRYREQSLSPADLTAMQQAVRALREKPLT
ncbi:DUF4129 domain-containing protein [Brevibacillus sp. GCM10020057]|uniref:DUF4129 domain-containing protein n=1 Tax=Brevibacillus sp. GCM10020057 TaxID=3317327 RepID=UPI0036297BC4